MLSKKGNNKRNLTKKGKIRIGSVLSVLALSSLLSLKYTQAHYTKEYNVLKHTITSDNQECISTDYISQTHVDKDVVVTIKKYINDEEENKIFQSRVAKAMDIENFELIKKCLESKELRKFIREDARYTISETKEKELYSYIYMLNRILSDSYRSAKVEEYYFYDMSVDELHDLIDDFKSRNIDIEALLQMANERKIGYEKIPKEVYYEYINPKGAIYDITLSNKEKQAILDNSQTKPYYKIETNEVNRCDVLIKKR